MSESASRDGHAHIAIVTGIVAFVLLSLLLVPGDLVVGTASLALAVLGAGLVTVWVMRRAAFRRSAWGACCIISGLLSSAVAVRFGALDQTWSGQSYYMDDLDHAIGPLTHFVWALVARIGAIMHLNCPAKAGTSIRNIPYG